MVKEATGSKIMPILLGFLATKAARWAALFATLIIAWFGFARHYENKGASRVVSQIETKAKVLNEKASQAYDAASKPGAADRLRKRYCLDC